MNKLPQAGSVRRLFHMRGASVLKTLLLIPVALVLVIALTVAFFEGRKAYWDYRVREMCEKDGGVKIYERVSVPPKYLDADGNIRLPSEPTTNSLPFEAKADDPYYYSLAQSDIKSGDLAVGRTLIRVIRAIDQKVLGEVVLYERHGGDFPTFAYPSRYVCPEDQGSNVLIKAVFNFMSGKSKE